MLESRRAQEMIPIQEFLRDYADRTAKLRALIALAGNLTCKCHSTVQKSYKSHKHCYFLFVYRLGF